MQQGLAQEERVAVGLGGEESRERLRHLITGQSLEQRLHVAGSEAVEGDAGGLHLSLKERECLGERMTTVEIGLAKGTDDRKPSSRREPRQRAQHADGRIVGPVQILDDEHDR